MPPSIKDIYLDAKSAGSRALADIRARADNRDGKPSSALKLCMDAL